MLNVNIIRCIGDKLVFHNRNIRNVEYLAAASNQSIINTLAATGWQNSVMVYGQK